MGNGFPVQNNAHYRQPHVFPAHQYTAHMGPSVYPRKMADPAGGSPYSKGGTQTMQSKSNKLKIKCKPKWDKCDAGVYKQSVKEYLRPFPTFRISSNSEVDILYPLRHLNTVLKMATADSIPKHMSEIQVR